jgi:hypothetical protein
MKKWLPVARMRTGQIKVRDGFLSKLSSCWQCHSAVIKELGGEGGGGGKEWG